MTFGRRVALAAALALAVPIVGEPHLALAQALRPEVGKPLQEASSLAKSRNISGAVAKVEAARKAATTAEERRKVGQMAAYVYTQGGQYAKAAQELEAVGGAPGQLAPLYYRAGQYDKAIATAKKGSGQDLQVIIAQSYLQQGKPAEAAKIYQQLVKQHGPRAAWLQNLAGAQYKAGDKQAYMGTIRQLIKMDPSPDRWRTLLGELRNDPKLSSEGKLALYQLMRETGTLTQPGDYEDFAKLAIIGDQPGVAKRALDEAMKANVIAPNDDQTARLVQAADKRAADAQAGVGSLPKTGEGLVKAGNVYFGAGDYAKAAAAYRQALAASPPKPDQAKVLLGISQVRAGEVQAAETTFESLPPTSPLKDVSDLWALYAQTKA
jgi:tetratricopeptide (TPR) repeat protein